MKRVLIFIALFASFGLGSCRCSDPPEIGPVEGEEEARVIPSPASETVPSLS